MAKELMYKARLIHGETYVLGDKWFRRGEEHLVTEEQRDYLEENAVDDITTDGVNEPRCKFQFVDEDDEWPAPRKRREIGDDREPARLRQRAVSKEVERAPKPSRKGHARVRQRS